MEWLYWVSWGLLFVALIASQVVINYQKKLTKKYKDNALELENKLYYNEDYIVERYKNIQDKKRHPLKYMIKNYFYTETISVYINNELKGKFPKRYVLDKAIEYEKKYKCYIADYGLYLYDKNNEEETK